MNKRIILISILFYLIFVNFGFGQITVNGTVLTRQTSGSPDACNSNSYRTAHISTAPTLDGGCIVMTPANTLTDGSAAWVCNSINLNNSFLMTTTVTFGSNTFNGDGIVFALKQVSSPNVVGLAGGNIGYHNPGPSGRPIGQSLGIEFDSFASGVFDTGITCSHAQMVRNGDLSNKVGGSTCLLPGGANVNDGLPHQICVFWDPAVNVFKAYFDGNMVINYSGDIRSFFSTPSAVHWGFTAGDGSGTNQNTHRICNTNMQTINVSNCGCGVKTWNGSVDTNWNIANNWTPSGVPTSDDCVVIPNVTNSSNLTGTNYNAFGKSLLVQNAGRLIIHPTNTLTIVDGVTVDAGGIFNIENAGSLIQINNVANIGIITMRRNTLIDALDYVYWSSPVASFATSAISPLTSTGFIWKWEPTIATAYPSNFGNWLNGNELMTPGRGYIVRAPSGWSATPSLYTASFVGVPNNGTITRPITRSNYFGASYVGPTSTLVTADDDNWNLLGNPYPSAISADDFLTTNLTHINAFLDLWKHGIDPSAAIADPFYQDYVINYSVNDYLRYNRLGGTQFGFDGKIGAGQSFFVLMRDAGATTENAIFNNSMRSNAHRNDQFFRLSEDNETATEFERHRIWLKMIAPNLASTDMLLGYATGATNNLDDEFDAINRGIKLNYELYSLAENQGLLIQGRSLPFDANDQVQLGVAISQNGIHTIAISGADGLFETPSQNIYLEDRELGIIHDLRSVPYTFTAPAGRYENRFVLRYTNGTLGNNDSELNAESINLITNNNLIISSSKTNIESIQIYDMLGRLLFEKENIMNKEVIFSDFARNNSTIVVLIKLTDGSVIKKLGVY